MFYCAEFVLVPITYCSSSEIPVRLGKRLIGMVTRDKFDPREPESARIIFFLLSAVENNVNMHSPWAVWPLLRHDPEVVNPF